MSDFGDTYQLDSAEAEDALARLQDGARGVGQAFRESGQEAQAAGQTYTAAGQSGGGGGSLMETMGGGRSWQNLGMRAAMGASPRSLAFQATRMGGAAGPVGAGAATALIGSYMMGRVVSSGMVGSASETNPLRRAYRAAIEKEGVESAGGKFMQFIGLGGARDLGLALRSRRLAGGLSRGQMIEEMGARMSADRAKDKEAAELTRKIVRASNGTERNTRPSEFKSGPSSGW